MHCFVYKESDRSGSKKIKNIFTGNSSCFSAAKNRLGYKNIYLIISPLRGLMKPCYGMRINLIFNANENDKYWIHSVRSF
ncbi:hypothetical protein GCM10009133_00020 [Cocleimonas flava]